MKNTRSLLITALLPLSLVLSACEPWHTSSGAATADPAARGEWSIGHHVVRLAVSLDADQARTSPAGVTPVRLSVQRTDRPGTPLFDTLPNESPLLAALVDVELAPGKLKTKVREWCREANFTHATAYPDSVELHGHLTCPSGKQLFRVRVDENRGATPSPGDASVQLTVSLGEGPANQITLRAASTPEETIDDIRDPAQPLPLKGERRRIADGPMPVLRTTTGRRIDIDSPPPLVINAADARLLQFDRVGRELQLRWHQQ